jgi:VCBS repeat-containing protein
MRVNLKKISSLLLPLTLAINPAFSQDPSEETVARPITIDDISSVKSPGSPRISPDGKHIVYLFDDQIFLAGSGGSESRPVTSSETTAWGVRWSGDSKSIYFLSDRGETTQVYELAIGSFGEAIQVTHFSKGVSPGKMSPNETRVLLTMSDNDQLEIAEDAEPQPFVVTRRHFKRDAGDGYIVDGDSDHLYVYDIDDQEMKQLTSGRYEERSASWSPDGDLIVFVSNRERDPDDGHRTDLWIVAANSMNDEPPLLRLTDSPGPKSSPVFSPDGEHIAYRTVAEGVYGVSHLTVIPATGGVPEILTKGLDRSVGQFEFSEDGNWIYFQYQDSGASNLARVRVRDRKIESLIEGDQAVRSFDVSDSGDIAVAINGQNDGANIFRLHRGKLTQLSDYNRSFFDERKLGNKTKVSFDNQEGIRIDAFITTPPDYVPGRAYPAVLNVHGGPQSQFQWGYSFKAQFLASNGYVVIEPNPRGSTGRGQAFLNAIYRVWGVPDYADVMAAVDYAVAEGIADPDKLAVTGYSYGGYMTNVAITQTTRFKAAASGAGHSHIEANFGHDIYQKWYMWELGFPWENRELYDVVSPVLRAGNVETPTLFYGGRLDWNVPILNAEIFYQSLQVQGIDSQLVVYPGLHHGGWPESFAKDSLERIVGWFDHYVLGQQ